MKTKFSLEKLVPEMTSRNLVILSATMVVLIFLVQGDAGFNLQDEGFLWYGTVRTPLGQIHIRDF